MIEALLALITAVIAESPAIIKDIEDLVNKAKAIPTGDPAVTPLKPVIEAETAPLAAKL